MQATPWSTANLLLNQLIAASAHISQPTNSTPTPLFQTVTELINVIFVANAAKKNKSLWISTIITHACNDHFN